MRSSRRRRGFQATRLAGLIVVPALLLGNTAYAGGLSLPDAARPGAQRPQETGPEIPKQPPGKLFEVPPVVQRPLKKEQGPKVKVTSFDLKGAQDRPKFGIKVSAIQAILDKQKATRPEGFTVGELQDVANAVTQYYRNHDLILAQAYVPAQTVKDGVVQIDVLEGKLGRVLVEGNKNYSTALLQSPFEDLLGKPVTKDATESALLTLTDYPGLSLFGVFQPGQEVGYTDMVLKVQKEKKFDGRIRWDNHGIRETGERRARLDLAWNNPTGAADRLKVILQQTFLERNSHYYGFEYNRPIYKPGYSVNLGYNENPFSVGGQFKGRDIAADTRIGNIALSRQFIRSRELNVKATLELSKKWAETTVQTRPVSVDNLTVLTGKLNYDSVDSRFSGLNVADVEVSHGFNDLFGSMGGQAQVSNDVVKPSRRGASGDFATGEFTKVFASFSRLQSMTPLGKLLKHPDFFKNQSLLFRAELQWSGDLLVPLEQYSVGGPNNVRAYRPTETLFDKAYFMSFEYMVNAPGFADKPSPFGNHTWGELLQVSAFYDTAYGQLNDPLPTQKASGNYNGAGFGVSFNNPGVFSSRLAIAWPIGGPEPVNKRDPQYWLDFNYTFW